MYMRLICTIKHEHNKKHLQNQETIGNIVELMGVTEASHQGATEMLSHHPSWDTVCGLY